MVLFLWQRSRHFRTLNLRSGRECWTVLERAWVLMRLPVCAVGGVNFIRAHLNLLPPCTLQRTHMDLRSLGFVLAPQVENISIAHLLTHVFEVITMNR